MVSTLSDVCVDRLALFQSAEHLAKEFLYTVLEDDKDLFISELAIRFIV